MPFSLAHTAAVPPLRRLLGRRAVTSALVIGTLVPDYRHFIPRHHHLDTHSPSALLWFALPVGLASYFVFCALLREPALALMPGGLRRRLRRLNVPAAPRPSLALVALSVIVGAASHIAWDAFTHRRTLIVESFPELFYRVVWRRGAYVLYVYGVLQHASSLVGTVAVVAWCKRWLGQQPIIDDPSAPAATAAERIVALAVLVVAPALALVARFAFLRHAGTSVRDAVTLAVSIAGDVFATAAVVFALVWRRRHPSPRSAGLEPTHP
jgi:Domain of unknown function (DUF4184)